MRNVPIFLLAALPALTMLVAAGTAAAPRSASRLAGTSAPRRGENERLNGLILYELGALAALVVGLTWMRPPARLQWQPVSAEAARAIAGCGAPLYNTYGRGGELIWFVPEQKVFVDNRQDPYPMTFLQAARTLEQDGQFRPLFERYGIQCAAIAPDSIVANALRSAGDWRVTYEDRQWLVFTRAR